MNEPRTRTTAIETLHVLAIIGRDSRRRLDELINRSHMTTLISMPHADGVGHSPLDMSAPTYFHATSG